MRFTDRAAEYEQHARIQRSVAAWSAQWLDEPTESEVALELGAGTGLFTRHLFEHGFKSVHATDLSGAMLRLGALNVPEVEWSLLNAWQPRWARKVDRLYSSSLLQWAEAPREVLIRWTQLLRPEGRLLVNFFVEGSLAELFPASSSLAALTWRSTSEWLTHFREAGWRVRRWRLWRETEQFTTATAALRSVHRTGAVRAISVSTADLRRMLLDSQKTHTLPTGYFPLTWRAIQIDAEPEPKT